MMDAGHDRFDELAAGYALDSLGGEERAEFERHVETCAVCAAAVGSYANAASAFAFAVPSRTPHASLRGRVMDAVTDTPEPKSALAWFRGWSLQLRVAMAAAVAVLALTIGALSVWVVDLRDDDRRNQLLLDRSYDALSVMASADLRWTIDGTDASAGAYGVVAYDDERGASSVVLWGLNEDPDLRYNVWVREASERTRVARLYASDGGFWAVMDRDVREFEGFGVTLLTSEGQAVDMVDTTLAVN